MGEKLFVAGLLSTNFNEVYYIINLETRKVKEIIVSNEEFKEDLISMINKQFANMALPYGSKDVNLFLPYLINPHSCYRVGRKMLSFMLQAPYFREINLDNYECRAITYGDNPTDIIFSASSNGISDNESIFLSINSSDERATIYNGIKKEMGFSFYKYNVEKSEFERCETIDYGLIDNMHQVGYSKNHFLVSLDMNISLEIDFNNIENLDNREMRSKYKNSHFPKGKIFLHDLKTRKSMVIEPPLCTPAHVEFDFDNGSVFYASCHNMSKFKETMVLHGPGAIIKYKYDSTDSRIIELGRFTERDFNRITTHKLFKYNEKSYLAIIGYPNYLYIIAADTMTLVKKIELFKAEIPVVYKEGVFVCRGNKDATLYLQVNSKGDEVYLVNGNMCFMVKWQSEDINSFEYTKKSFAVSAHLEIF